MLVFKPGPGRPVLIGLAAIAVSLMLAQCNRDPTPRETPAGTEAPDAAAPPPATVVPTAVQPLTRGELVSASGQAASAYVSGGTTSETDPLVGRPFAIRIPFGCRGPSLPTEGAALHGLAHWTWGQDRKTIQISLTPGDWTGSALTTSPGAQAAPHTWEAVEGFWVPRPWLASETCPSLQADPLQTAETASSPQTVGIAAVFETGGSRIGRRNGRAYAFTVRPPGEDTLAPPTQGYRLLLEGRVVGFPGGRAIRCRAPSPDQRPVCVVAVQLDKVAFETAQGVNLSEWREG